MIKIIKKVYNKIRSYSYNPFDGMLSTREYRRLKRLPAGTPGKTLLFDKSFEFSDSSAFLFSMQEQFLEKTYLFKAQSDTPFIIDCGANIGLASLYFLTIFPKATVMAFEPDKNIYGVYIRNMESFSLTDSVQVFNSAVWVENTELNFFADNSLAGSLEFDAQKKGNLQKVNAIRLKDILRNKKIDFLKIDIEGAEFSVIFDIEDELKNVECLFLEYHNIVGRPEKLSAILSVITKAGFRFYIKNGFDYCKHPFTDIKLEMFDFCINIFCYRN